MCAMTAPIQARVFQCAAELVGGPGHLCDRLGVSPNDLSRWITNEETSPLLAFFGALDIVLESKQGFAAVFPHRRRRETAEAH
jgi:hypothetical protein